MGKQAIIIGAGPAGLTAAYELLKRTDVTPIILEKSGDIGGISKTINYKGNRMDIGGHRFFSKSDRVMNWWMNIMPVQPSEDTYTTITYQRNHRTIKKEETHGRENGEDLSKMMLIRKRLSRIYFLRKFFTYPIQLSIDTLRKLGPIRTLGILASYTKAQLFQRKPEKSLEDFLINRFGKKLYLLFFKDYTEKVWGVPCHEISAEWGAQRIKGVSVSKAIQHAIQAIVKKKKGTDISQKGTETSLIEQFLYPALGPGQLWEEVARQIEVLGGKIFMHEDVKEIQMEGNQIKCVITQNSETGEQTEYCGDYFFSTMPVQELIAGMNGQVPEDVKEIAAGLQYRDFITIGVLLKKLGTTNNQKTLPDTWIYIQEKDVKVGRLQIFNNWSPFMVKDPDTVWIGMEYFCNKEDEFWNLPDEEIQRVGVMELEKMGLANIEDVLDSTVLRMEKTYPAYFGTYNQFDKIREFTDRFENLFLVGRNGMHKYNNSDHSMLTGMVSVDNICKGDISKENIWTINTEQKYHEEKQETTERITKNNKQKLSNIEHSIINDNATKDIKRKTISTEGEFILSFKDFLFKNFQYKIFILIAVMAIIIQFSVFKYFYPVASFIHGDSFVYLQMAYHNQDTDMYPIGYPRFLRLFSVFSSSDIALTSFQYIAIQFSALFLLFTVFYFYQPPKIIQFILGCFIVFNPLFWHIANLVSSDAIFLAASCTWFSLLLWIIHRPNNKIIIIQAIVLLYAFTVRYNALIYPVVAAVAFGLSPLSIRNKIAAISLTVLLCGLFVLHTGNKYKKLTGTWQFSPFSGWQLTNNAMYAYRYVDSANRKPVPMQFQRLDYMIRMFFDTTLNKKRLLLKDNKIGTFYMWSPRSPLQKYMEVQYAETSTITKYQKWASVGPLYTAYGSFLIKHYPFHFIENYLWPNMIKYYTPPVEFLEKYNMGKDTVNAIAKTWFAYNSQKVKLRLKDNSISILNFYPVLAGTMNVLFISAFICLVLLNGFRDNSHFRKFLVLVIAIWLLNAAFTIFASPAALRFQAFPILTVTIFSAILLSRIYMVVKEEIEKSNLVNNKVSITLKH